MLKLCLAFFDCPFMRFVTSVNIATVMYKGWLITFLWVGIVEAKPSSIESASLQERNIRAELVDCGLECMELRHKESLHRVGPVGNDRVDNTKLCKKDIPKCSTSGGLSGFVVIAPNEISNETRRPKSTA